MKVLLKYSPTAREYFRSFLNRWELFGGGVFFWNRIIPPLDQCYWEKGNSDYMFHFEKTCPFQFNNFNVISMVRYEFLVERGGKVVRPMGVRFLYNGVKCVKEVPFSFDMFSVLPLSPYH